LSSNYTREEKIIFISLVELLAKGISYQAPQFFEILTATSIEFDKLNDEGLEFTFVQYCSVANEGGVDRLLKSFEDYARERFSETNINIRFRDETSVREAPKKKSWFRRLFSK
jgi:hypothetical protein